MINASGIGTYIKNTLPKVITNIENSKFYLLGRKEELEELNFNRFSNVKLIDFNAPIYSIKEQIIFPFKIPKNITLFGLRIITFQFYIEENCLFLLWMLVI